MKRLMILTAVLLVAAASGCKNCGLCGGGATPVYRPTCPSPPCTGGVGTYPAPGAYTVPGATSPPVLTAPQTIPGQTFPGPEVYTPAN
jgi:hypothetical protein